MRYLSVCSGVGTDHIAWQHLGWQCIGFAEIDSFASVILAHRFPGLRNYGDFTQIPASVGPVDLLVGGTPCQSFSVAGQRLGLDDPRGNLTLEFARLARRLRAQWIVWENVPGVLSSDRGRDFATILGAFRECGYSVAYRVLDAQYFGVPQRRRRVFVVGHLGDDWRSPAQVLFESPGLPRDTPKGRTQRQEVAGTLGGGSESRGWSSDLDRTTFIPVDVDATRVNGAVSSKWWRNSGGPVGDECQNLLSGAWWDGGQLSQTLDAVIAKQQMMPDKNRFPVILQTAVRISDNPWTRVVFASEVDEDDCCPNCGIDYGDCPCPGPTQEGMEYSWIDGVLHARPENAGVHTEVEAQAIAFDAKDSANSRPRKVANPIKVGGAEAVAFTAKDYGGDAGPLSPKLRSGTHDSSHANGGVMPAVAVSTVVRRLTPRECERLQGLPDDWTLVPYRGKPAADAPRYKAIGNGMAVPVLRWIGQRIAARFDD